MSDARQMHKTPISRTNVGRSLLTLVALVLAITACGTDQPVVSDIQPPVPAAPIDQTTARATPPGTQISTPGNEQPPQQPTSGPQAKDQADADQRQTPPPMDAATESCLRQGLSKTAFQELFVTESRSESNLERPILDRCFGAPATGSTQHGENQNQQPQEQGRPPAPRSGSQQGPPSSGQAPAAQGPSLTPQIEACLRGVLTPDAFTAVFITGSRGESATEAPLIGQCFESQGSGSQQGTPPAGQSSSQGSGSPQGPPSSGQAPASQGPALNPQIEACLRSALTPDAFTAVFVTGSRGESAAEAPLISQCFESQGSGGQQGGTPPSSQAPSGQSPSQGSGGQQSAQSSWETREAHMCYRAGLGTQVFNDVVLNSKRESTAAESETMATCRSLGGPGSDMPVFDLAQVYKPELFPRVYPKTMIGTSAHSWFEFMDVMADQVEFERLQATGTNTFYSVLLYGVDTNGNAFIQRPKEAANLVIRARIRGLAVHLSLDTFTYDVPCSGSYEENLASYIRVQTQAALLLAKFADDLNVEYLSPGNEHEGNFQGPCLDSRLSQNSGRHPDKQMLDPRGEPGLTARVAISSKWHLDILPDLRALFGGHLVPDYGSIHPEAVTPGYDGLVFTLDHAHLSEEKFSARVQANYEAAAEAAGRSGEIPWYVNAYLPYSLIAELTNPEMPEYDPSYVIDEEEDARMKLMQEIYVAVSIATYRDFNAQGGTENTAPGGYSLAGWIDKGKEIRGSNMEEILIENFG